MRCYLLSLRLSLKGMDKFISFFRNVSFLIFLGTLIWSYAYMAGQVNYRYDNLGDSIAVADKNTYFFIALAVFLFANGVCQWFVLSMKKITTSEEGTGLRNRSLKLDLMSWVKGFAGVLNIFFSLVLIFLGLMNLSANYNISTLGFYVYLGPILIVGWFFYLAAILGKRRN